MPAHRCVEENGLAAMLATQRSAGVRPECNMYVTSPNKAAHSGFEIQRRHHQKSKTGISVAPQKRLMFSKILKKITKKRIEVEIVTIFVQTFLEKVLHSCFNIPNIVTGRERLIRTRLI